MKRLYFNPEQSVEADMQRFDQNDRHLAVDPLCGGHLRAPLDGRHRREVETDGPASR
jgi:hypothetical protein